MNTMYMCSKTLSLCGEVEDRLAKEWIKFELDVENYFIQAMQNISEVVEYSSI